MLPSLLPALSHCPSVQAAGTTPRASQVQAGRSQNDNNDVPIVAGSPIGAHGLLWDQAGRSASWSIPPAHPPTHPSPRVPGEPVPISTFSLSLGKPTSATGKVSCSKGAIEDAAALNLCVSSLPVSPHISPLLQMLFSVAGFSLGLFSPSHPLPHLQEPKLVTD